MYKISGKGTTVYNNKTDVTIKTFDNRADAINFAKYLNTLRIYDNGGKTLDRYTIIFMDRPERQYNTFTALGCNSEPFHGIGQNCIAMPGRHLGKRIGFEDCPSEVQKFIMQEL